MKIDESKIKFEEKEEATFTDPDGKPIYLFEPHAVDVYHYMASYDYEGHRYFGIGRTKDEAVVHLKKALGDKSEAEYWGRDYIKRFVDPGKRHGVEKYLSETSPEKHQLVRRNGKLDNIKKV